MTPDDRCCWPKCRTEYGMTYLGRKLCSMHWKEMCDLTDWGKAEELSKALGLPLETIKATMGAANE